MGEQADYFPVLEEKELRVRSVKFGLPSAKAEAAQTEARATSVLKYG